MKYVFINHGFLGSNIENWYPWLKDKLDSKDRYCIIPQYPIDGDKHFYKYWKKVIDVYNELGYINSDTIFIGHSSGAIFSIKYLIENNIKVDKLILVSCFNNYYTDDEDEFHRRVVETFYIDDSELSKINDLCNEIIFIYGDNDPYITQDSFKELVSKLRAKEVVINNGGHLNTSYGYDTFEELLKYI